MEKVQKLPSTICLGLVLYGYTRSWIHNHISSYRRFSYVGPLHYELRQEYSFFFYFLARLLLLCRFLYTIIFNTLSFSVLYVVSSKKGAVTFILA